MLKTMSRSITCIDTCCHDETKCSCQCCYSTIDILSYNRKKRTNAIKRERPWKDSYAKNESRTLFHLDVSKYLYLSTDVTAQEEHKNTQTFHIL